MNAEPISAQQRALIAPTRLWRLLVRAWNDAPLKTRRLIPGLALAVALPFVSEVVADFLDRRLDVHAPNMVFLCSVIFTAMWFGRIVGITSALCAFLVYNFYLTEPRGMIGFAGLEDVLTLLVFVGVALITGGLAGNLHDERDLAREQVRIFANLFEVSRPLAECDNPEQALRLLETGARQMAAKDAVVIHLDGRTRSEPRELPGSSFTLEQAAQAMLRGETPDERIVRGWRLQAVRSGDQAVAVLAWLPHKTVAFDQLAIAVRLLSEMTGITIERARYIDRQLEMESLAATDKLRTALMSSISHDFRTPLSTILTSSTSLLAYGEHFSPATHVDLLTSIQEEAERLNRFVSNIMDMTRLDAGVIKPRRDWTDPLEVIENVHERMRRRLGDRTLTLDAPAAVPSIRVDALLLEQAIVNAVENALVHAPESAIRVGAAYDQDNIKLWVEDDGPGVPPSQLTNIFDKFHRLNGADSGQGGGLGLAISKGFVEAMHGRIYALSPARDGRGLNVAFVFKRDREALT